MERVGGEGKGGEVKKKEGQEMKNERQRKDFSERRTLNLSVNKPHLKLSDTGS